MTDRLVSLTKVVWNRFIEWLVGDRCPADPCASENGLKMRTYAVILLPTLGFAGASAALTPGTLPARVLMGLAAAWFTAMLLNIPREINKMESCDDVELHYGETETSAEVASIDE